MTMVICPVFLSTSSPQESQGEAYSSSLSPKKKGKGGRKKNLHPPTPTIMKHRRNMANARERKRMNGLNDAFERLREVVPNVNTEQVCLHFFNNKQPTVGTIDLTLPCTALMAARPWGGGGRGTTGVTSSAENN